ncbi:MAG TPA: rhodanese-like domain-containing protein [Kiritimatiellia bacterium]|nr:rhodanese-like domain-containing protein [Kiritimatiellia bacterium]
MRAIQEWRNGMLAAVITLAAGLALAEETAHPKAKVSFEDFKGLVAEVESHRAERLVDLDTFLRMSREPDTIILDTRSTFRYERIHIKGAKHLSFTDFTQDALRGVIPSFDTRVLIYCNNNFEGNPVDFASKIAMPMARPPVATTNPASMRNTFRLSRQFATQEKPLMMALNIPTYINLFGYGYHNVYELDELVDVSDPRVEFEGSLVGRP